VISLIAKVISHSFGQIKLGREIFLPEKFEAETRPPMLQLAEL
jgi:hypothetical protein